jgi:hypothetical protein
VIPASASVLANTVFEATVTPTCANGFEETSVGIVDIKCVVTEDKKGVEWTTQTGCKRSDCNTPIADTPYVMPTTIASTVFEAEVTPTCKAGYDRTGAQGPSGTNANKIQCVWNDVDKKVNWQAQTGCQRQDCNDPTADLGYKLQASFTDAETLFESVINVECATGWETKTSVADITCVVDGTSVAWTGQSGCQRKDCKTPIAETPYVMPTDITNTLYEAKVQPICAPGYEPSNPTAGVDEITCLSTGLWSAQGGCVRQNCKAPPADTGYVIPASASVLANTVFEATVTPTCAVGFEDVGDGIVTIKCVVTEDKKGVEWTSQGGCTRVPCGEPAVDDGYKIFTGTSVYESVRQVTCIPGFKGDDSTITCQANKQWTAQAGCTRISCGEPVVATGYVIPSGTTLFRDTRQPSCATGFENLVTIPKITCQADKTWSAQASCTRVSCGSVAADTGYVLADGTTLGTGIDFESTKTLTCAPGYEGNPPATIKCNSNRLWDSQTGCAKVSCPAPTAMTGYGLAAGGDKFQDTRAVTCLPGYVKTAGTPTTITCQANKTWTEQLGCVLGDCGAPPATRGYVTDGKYESTKAFTKFTPDCARGWKGPNKVLEEPSTEIECQTDLTWSSMSGCNIVICEVPDLPLGYALNVEKLGEKLTYPDDYEYGKKHQFFCKDDFGFTYEGQNALDATGDSEVGGTIQCLSNGNWTLASGCVLADASQSFNSPAATAAPVSLFALLGLAMLGVYFN